MYRSIMKKGRDAADQYAGTEDYFYLSPAGLALYQALLPCLEGKDLGRVLDAGAGRGAYRDLLLRHGADYVGMDIQKSSITALLGDAQTLPFKTGSFDVVFCSQVLEHVPEPHKALAEFRRVLQPNGILILTVPHISWLHNEPNDYFRFTKHGLDFLLRGEGFQVETTIPAGGLPALLGHIVSTLCVNGSFGIPILGAVVLRLNRIWTRLVTAFDQRVEKKKLFALNYVCIARPVINLQQREST